MASIAGRKTKIRPPRRGLNGTEVDFDTSWQILERAFVEIHTKNASMLSFEELYRNAYKMVLNKKGDELYKKVAHFEQTWLSETVRERIVQLMSAQLLFTDDLGKAMTAASERRVAGEAFLRALKQAWEDHQVCMGMLTDVLMYMDRVYCTDKRQPSIFAKAMSLFRDHILRTVAQLNSPLLLDILIDVILDQILMDRAGDSIDPFLIKSCVYMLEGLYDSDLEAEDEKLYLLSFEPVFLRTSADFYREEGERLLKESDAGTYCKHARRRIDEEIDRCRSTLSDSTAPKVQQVVENELIRNKIKSLIDMDSGVEHMVENDKLYELSLVFDLEERVDDKKPELTRALQKIIAEQGAAINQAAAAAAQAPAAPSTLADEADGNKAKDGSVKQINQQTTAALKWVEDILALRDRFHHICATSFGSDQLVSTALTRSIADKINAFNRASEYMSLFIDENMKKGIKNKSEAEIDQTLDKAITMLRYLTDKDLFETYYKKHLCKRLLLGKSQSIDVEKQMIGRMKIELGNSFTLKLEAMFKDMTLSEELTNDFRKRVAGMGDPDPSRVDLSVNVLTSMTWPIETFRSEDGGDNKGQVVYPPAIERIKLGFERFYAEKHSGRRLTWQGAMGEADIKATFPHGAGNKPRTHDINCSTYAMLILLLFNDLGDGQSLTLEEIHAQTNIPMHALTRNLQSLAVAPKTRFLIKEPMSREVNAGDRFAYNANFQSKVIRIKVGVVSAGNKAEGDRERKETEKKNHDSRGFQIEAAVVRIMKSRKELSHANLLTETLAVLSAQFKPDVNMIKKRIESLIEREYLERIEDAPTASYRYLA